MNGIRETKAKIQRLNPNDGNHYYYGYYDNPAFNKDDKKHLCNKVKFWDRFPTCNDICEMGVFDLETGSWKKYAETRAFNFQQGCMLHWNPLNPGEEIIYNVRDGNEYRCIVHNIKTSEKKILPAAIFNVSRDGKWGLAINMNRIYDFRPGYGYSDVRDKWYDIPQPKDDGIHVVNMQTGAIDFIINYEEIGRLFSIKPDEKIVINHITFSPDNNRLLFLVRTFPLNGKPWLTGLGTIDREGKNFHLMNPMSMASHYHWKDENHLLIWANIKNETGMHLVTDQSDESFLLDPDFFKKDIHCIYSPDLKYILGDGYPDMEGYRQIFLYKPENKKGMTLLSVKSDPIASGDIRSDLHNRWSRVGKIISFDSTHEGFRGLYTADLSEILENY